MSSGSLVAVAQHSNALSLLQEAASSGQLPGGVLDTGSRNASDYSAAFGTLTPAGPQVTDSTHYDLASLTKVVATLPAILQLLSSGEISLDRPLRYWFSSAGWFQQPSLADSTVRQLLAHNSGLPAWQPLFTKTRDRLLVSGIVQQAGVSSPGGPAVYSDLGFMLLGTLIERVTGQRLDTYVNEQVFGPLGMLSTDFRPFTESGSPEASPEITFAPTEYCGWRNRLLAGEVHDENCCAWQGVAGHAGLFGTAADVGLYARAWLNLDTRLGKPELLEEALRQQSLTPAGEPRGLGWLLGHQDGFAGNLSGYGHTGFTGTSLWLDPHGDRYTVLLTNRVHPDRHRAPSITTLRRKIHAVLHERNRS